MRRRSFIACGALALAVVLSGCEGAKPPPTAGLSKRSTLSAQELVSHQARLFRTTNQPAVLRGIVRVLMDQGYVLNRVDSATGQIWANRGAYLKLLITVSPRGSATLMVRAVGEIRDEATMVELDDAAFYEETFFVPLSAALGLPALPAA